MSSLIGLQCAQRGNAANQHRWRMASTPKDWNVSEVNGLESKEQRAMKAPSGTDARRREVLMKYANHLENRHGRSAVLSHRTQRIYRQVATHFLEATQTSDTESLTENQVTSFLKENAGSRNSLGPFLTFLGSYARGLTLSLPVRGVTCDGVGRAQKVAALVTALRGRLSKARHRALMAELLRILYGLSRSEVLAMGVADVALRGNQARVLIRGDWLEVPPPAARLVALYHAMVVEHGGDKLFPGRGPAGVLDPTSVAFHLRGLSRA